MRFLISFSMLAVLAASGAAHAQSAVQRIPDYAKMHHEELRVFSDANRTKDVATLPQASSVTDYLLREERIRIVSSMVRKGRCDDALNLSRRQNDEALAERVAAVCATQGSKARPT